MENSNRNLAYDVEVINVEYKNDDFAMSGLEIHIRIGNSTNKSSIKDCVYFTITLVWALMQSIK